MQPLVTELLNLYFPLFGGAIAQSVFLLLPVDLRNWEDDMLNVLTYVGMQVFVACFVFIAIPMGMNVFQMSMKTAVLVLAAVFICAWLRALKIIPLEFTYPVTKIADIPLKHTFLEFRDPSRLRQMVELERIDRESGRRVVNLRERLLRKKAERADS